LSKTILSDTVHFKRRKLCKKKLGWSFCIALDLAASCKSAPVQEAVQPVAAKAVVYQEFGGTITTVEKYGHTVTDIRVEDLFSAGYALGDVLSVSFANGYHFDAPLVSAYDVERNQYLLRTEYGEGYVAACINYGNLATDAKLAVLPPLWSRRRSLQYSICPTATTN
jgi:S-adenosylmethionine hydrolase